MKWLFEVRDRNNVPVRMSKATYDKHLPKHPEIADYIEEAKLTVEDPELIYRDKDGCHHHYRFGLGEGKYADCYLRVLVRYPRRWGRKQGVVSSFWFSRNVGKGELIWMKRDH